MAALVFGVWKRAVLFVESGLEIVPGKSVWMQLGIPISNLVHASSPQLVIFLMLPLHVLTF